MINQETYGKYLIFEVDQAYALEIDKIIEIVELSAVTPVPETPDYIAGVINLRGQVVPLIDIRCRFKCSSGDLENKRRCVVIVDFEGAHIGLMVDNVLELADIPDENISPPPQVGNDYVHVFVKAIGVVDSKMMLIIDPERIVNFSDLDFLKNNSEGESNEKS